MNDNEEEKDFMRKNSKRRKEGQACPLPPQLFLDDEYLGVSIAIFLFGRFLN